MKKLNLLLAVTLLTAVFACKKESSPSSGTGTGTYIRIKQNPPAGYTFPSAFGLNASTINDFNLYVGGAKINNPSISATDIWELEDDFDEIVLDNKDSLSILLDGDVITTAGYYFTQDSLIVISPFWGEIAFAKGNYNGFASTQGMVYHKASSSSLSYIEIGVKADLNYALTSAELQSLNEMEPEDTLAFANRAINFNKK